MTFLPECGSVLYFSIEKDFFLFKWMHNDFMYVRFGGIEIVEEKYKDLEQVYPQWVVCTNSGFYFCSQNIIQMFPQI